MAEVDIPASGMPLVNVNQYGATYLFGLSSSDAPTIAGMKPISAEVIFEPEVWERSQEGEGHTDSVTVSKPDKAMGTVTVSGYISDLTSYKGLSGTKFQFDGRAWIVKKSDCPGRTGSSWKARWMRRVSLW